MPTRLISVVFDALEPVRLARFWVDALGWTVTVEQPDEIAVEAGQAVEWGDGGTPCLTFVPVMDPKTGKNRVHLDLVSTTRQHQRDTVERLLALGGRRVDIGQGDVPWIVLADPEDNELCVLEPRADYAGTRDIAAVVLDCADPERLAGFWSQTTGWPVASFTPDVVSLRHPGAGAPHLELLTVPEPKHGKNRLHLDVAPYPGDALAGEVARLEAAGARRVDIGQGDVASDVLAEPRPRSVNPHANEQNGAYNDIKNRPAQQGLRPPRFSD